ncbi:MAG TPA: regulatory protein RecX [Actinomycetota bacterium]|nr:regulatory protein RecX [Actinomycetota bacterium]
MSTRERPRTSAKDRALRLLSVRSRSRVELERRLARAGYEPNEVAAAIADLEEVGLVDDERFARELAEAKRRRGMGRRAGLAALRAKGVDRETAEQAVGEVNPEDEADRAYELARARLERLRARAPDVASRRTVEYLIRRGFEPVIARTAVRRAEAEVAR